jgi:hypothetical protein
MHRVATWLIVIWTGLMALGILAAAMGINGDANAWFRGGFGLMLLVFLWFVVLLPMAAVWLISRPKAGTAPR